MRMQPCDARLPIEYSCEVPWMPTPPAIPIQRARSGFAAEPPGAPLRALLSGPDNVLDLLSADGSWLIVEPMAEDRVEDNLNAVGRAYYGFSTLLCTPGSLSQEVGLALGAQAGEASEPTPLAEMPQELNPLEAAAKAKGSKPGTFQGEPLKLEIGDAEAALAAAQ